MENLNDSTKDSIVNLKQAAERLSVTIDTLLKWNEYNILKPIITQNGEVGYKEEQIQQFLTIRQLHKNQTSRNEIEASETRINQGLKHKSEMVKPSSFSVMPFIFITPVVAMVTVFVLTGGEVIKAPAGNTTDQSIQKAVVTDKSVADPLLSASERDKVSSGTDMVSYAQTAYQVSDQSMPDSVFDSNGNIKGETSQNDVLADNNMTGGLIRSDPVKQTVDLNLIWVILAVAFLSMPFVFQKKPDYAGVGQAQNTVDLTQKRVLEVGQKTDGSVVLYFQDQEYKLSKPELDSESDQFIEKLMGLAKTEAQEIDYNAAEDPETSLSAPLSKLVTRLGFVGIKRELFFPRTSKNRVLFRRFLTQTDLDSMNLSQEKLFRELENSN